MSRFFRNSVTLKVNANGDDEMRALYRALLQSRQQHRTEAERLRLRRGSGYGTDSDSIMYGREAAMERMVDRLLSEVTATMEAEEVEPW